MNFDGVRQWQVQIVVPHYDCVPLFPDIVVEEVENTRLYRLDGIYRENEAGGQIVVTLGGRGILKIGDEKVNLVPGKAFIHKHSDAGISYYYPLDGTEPWRFVWVSLLGSRACDIIDGVVGQYGYVFDVMPDSELVKKMFTFKCEDKQVRCMSPYLAAETAFSFLHWLCEGAGYKSSRHSNLVSQVQMHIATEFRKPLTVADISREFQVSREHLSRVFSAETGMCIHDYITSIRMKVALSLLRETRLTVKEIATQCGYSRYSVFYKTFIAFYKCPPGVKRPDRRKLY